MNELEHGDQSTEARTERQAVSTTPHSFPNTQNTAALLLVSTITPLLPSPLLCAASLFSQVRAALRWFVLSRSMECLHWTSRLGRLFLQWIAREKRNPFRRQLGHLYYTQEGAGIGFCRNSLYHWLITLSLIEWASRVQAWTWDRR